MAVCSPFRDLTAGMAVRPSTKPLLLQVSRTLEAQAAQLGSTALVLSAFQHARNVTPGTAERYRLLAQKVGVLGRGMDDEPIVGVRGGDVDPGDPIVREWDIAVLSTYFAAALLARERGDISPDTDCRFEFRVTYDRKIVERVAESLLARIRPSWGGQG